MPIKAIEEDDRILDETQIKTDSYASGTGVRQPVLEAGTIPLIRMGLLLCMRRNDVDS